VPTDLIIVNYIECPIGRGTQC